MIQNISIKILRTRHTIDCEYCTNVGKLICKRGEITLGDFKEKFIMRVDYWTIKDYKRQWKEGLERILTHNRSCLVTDVQNPRYGPLVEMWGLYKKGNMIYIRNYLFCGDIYKKRIGDKPFTPETCYDFILNRTKNLWVSEWVVSLE